VSELLKRLKYGSAPWNLWRREHPDLVISLDHADLNGMILIGIDFARVSLRGASLHATNLMNADLRGHSVGRTPRRPWCPASAGPRL